MKKILLALLISISASCLFAYNPPYGGEEIFRLTNPVLMSGAASASGGPNYTIVPSSITYNPALTASEQRIDLDVSGTLFFNLDKVDIEGADSDESIGGGFQVGMIIPTRWTVLTWTTSGLFSDFYGMDLRKTIISHVGASKELTENLSLGANAYLGFYTGSGSDFSVGADLGALYRLGDLGTLKSSRVGLAFLNLGKPADYDTIGIDEKKSSSSYPSIFTPRVSFAADFLEMQQWVGSFSTDLAFPAFQNCICDLGLGFDYNNTISLSLGAQANIREIAEGKMDGLSSFSLGVSIRLGITSKKMSEKNADWEQSEVIPSFATQYLYSGILATSFGCRLDLGLKDTEAPEIYVWNEE